MHDGFSSSVLLSDGFSLKLMGRLACECSETPCGEASEGGYATHTETGCVVQPKEPKPEIGNLSCPDQDYATTEHTAQLLLVLPCGRAHTSS